jgi:hypothetical protein
MRSESEKAGRTLLHKWATEPRSIRRLWLRRRPRIAAVTRAILGGLRRTGASPVMGLGSGIIVGYLIVLLPHRVYGTIRSFPESFGRGLGTVPILEPGHRVVGL